MTEPAEPIKKCGISHRWKILIAVLIGFCVVMAGLRLYLTPILRTAVSEVGKKVLGVPVSLGDVSIWFLLGRVEIKELKVGNPEGFHAPQILVLQRATADIALFSLFTDKLRIEEITVEGLELFYEQGLSNNNISVLKTQIEMNTGAGENPKAEEKTGQETPAKKIQLDLLDLHNNRIHCVVMKQNVTMPLPPVRMENLGTGPEGITGGELLEAVLDQLSLGAISTIKEATVKYGNQAMDSIQKTGRTTMENLQQSSKKIGNQIKGLFQSK